MYELQRTGKFYMRSFMFFLETSSERPRQRFFPLLHFHLHQKVFIRAKSNQKYPNILQSYSIGSSLANRDIKDPVVIQTSLIARSALSGY